MTSSLRTIGLVSRCSPCGRVLGLAAGLVDRNDDSMEFRSEITLGKNDAIDLAGALHMAAVELRRKGVFELAHRLDGLTDWLEELLVADQDDEG